MDRVEELGKRSYAEQIRIRIFCQTSKLSLQRLSTHQIRFFVKMTGDGPGEKILIENRS